MASPKVAFDTVRNFNSPKRFLGNGQPWSFIMSLHAWLAPPCRETLQWTGPASRAREWRSKVQTRPAARNCPPVLPFLSFIVISVAPPPAEPRGEKKTFPKNLLRLFLTSESYFYFLRLFLKPLRKYTVKQAKNGHSWGYFYVWRVFLTFRGYFLKITSKDS